MPENIVRRTDPRLVAVPDIGHEFIDKRGTDQRVMDDQGRVIRSLEEVRLTNQAYQVLKVGFIAAPLIAGVDKFFNFLTDWSLYLAPVIPDTLGVSTSNFMLGVGVIEIVAGLGVAFKPKIFAYVVSVWLVGIVINLLLTGTYYDIALRDFVLALGAFVLGRLSQRFELLKAKAF